MPTALVIRKSPSARDEPNIYGVTKAQIPYYSYIEYSEIIPEKGKEKTRVWLKLSGKYEGLYTAWKYPTNPFMERLGQTTEHLQIDPATPKYIRVKHDWEIHGLDRLSLHYGGWRNVPNRLKGRGDPETVKLYCPDGRVWLREKLQGLWYEAIKLARPGQPEAEYKRVFGRVTSDHRSHTNKTGSDTCRDYINGTNAESEDMRYEAITCGGNIHQEVIPPFKKFGIWHVGIRVINARDFEIADVLALGLTNRLNINPVIQWATISRNDINGIRFDRVEPYWDWKDGSNAGVPIPLLAPKTYWLGIPLDRIEAVTEPYPSPYNYK